MACEGSAQCCDCNEVNPGPTFTDCSKTISAPYIQSIADVWAVKMLVDKVWL